MQRERGRLVGAKNGPRSSAVVPVVSHSHRCSLLVLVDVPLLVQVDKPEQQPVQSAPRGHLDVHGHKEGQEEENPARQRHELRVAQVAGPASTGCRGGNGGSARHLLAEADDGDAGAGNHDHHSD